MRKQLKVAMKFWRLGIKFEVERRSRKKKKIIDAKPKTYSLTYCHIIKRLQRQLKYHGEIQCLDTNH